MKTLLALSVGLVLVSSQADAHHSFAASFVDTEIVREGVVNRLIFRNPHVIIYMTVTDANGTETEWMVEGSAATSLRRAGWTNRSVQPGEHVRITGRAGRDTKPMISMGNVEVLDPETRVVLRNSAVRAVPAEPSGDEILAKLLLLADGRPDLSGAWGRARGGPSFRNHREPPFNETGVAVQAQWDPADDPQVACEDPTLVRQAGFTPHPVRIEEFDDYVRISYEEYGGVRTIYLDGRDAGSAGDSLVKLGRSTARYEDSKLIIESTHIPGGPTGTGGNRLSDQTTTVETYRRLDDPTQGPMIEMEMIINDPDHLNEPWEMVWKKLYTENYEFIAVECHTPY